MIATATIPIPPTRDVRPAVAAPTAPGSRRAAVLPRLPLVLALTAALTAGCGGGGGGAASPVLKTTDVNAAGRVVLGALGGATVAVYRVGSYAAPVATATTSTGGTLAEIGNFSFSLSGVPADAMFLLVATGGAAYDANEDGVLDGPTPNQGSVHALASAAQLKAQPVRLSAVTEVVYQRVRYFLEALYGDAYVSQACDSWASFVLRSTTAGGPEVRNDDALAFDPLVHAAATFRPYAPHFLDLVGRLLNGQSATEAAFRLSREEIHFEDLEGQTPGVALAGNLAFLCRGPDGLDVWNVADPTAPQHLSTYDTPGFAARVQVVGTLAYVADGAGGLEILDVSDPSQPALVCGVATPEPVADLHVVGGRAYLAEASAEPMLLVVDVTTPAYAAIVGEVATADTPTTVRAEGDFAYVMEPGKIETFDVGNPVLPVSRGTVPADSYARMDLGPGHLFVASDTRLEVLSLDTPASPQPIATLPLPGFGAYGIRVRGSEVLLARSFDGLSVVDVADPANPSFVGLVPTSGSALDVDRDGTLCVVAEANGGLGTVGAGTPAPSGVVASVPLAFSVDAVDASGGRAYVATTNPSKLTVLDTSDPLAPAVLGSVPLATHLGEDVVVGNGLAFVAEYGGLEVYDVSNPTAPSHVGGDATLGGLQRLAMGPNLAYAAADDHFGVYDVTTPADTTLHTSLRVSGQARGLDAASGSVVLAAGSQGVLAYDATTRSDPVLAGVCPAPGALDVALRSPYAFVTQFSDSGIDDRLLVVDLSDLTAPTVSHSVVLPGAVGRVSLSGGFAYVSAGVSGVNVVDVSAPTSAFHVGTIPVPADVRDLDVEGGYVYVAGVLSEGSLMVLRAAQVAVP